MRSLLLVGGGLTTVGAAGYFAGIAVAYPGRAFSVTAVMVGVTLVAMGSPASDGDE